MAHGGAATSESSENREALALEQAVCVSQARLKGLTTHTVQHTRAKLRVIGERSKPCVETGVCI